MTSIAHIAGAVASSLAKTASWRTVWTSNLTDSTTSTGWAGYTLRDAFPNSAITGTASKIRITFKTLLTGLEIQNCYIGVKAPSGDVYDYAATPTQILFGGLPNVVMPPNVFFVSDEIDFTYSTGGLVIALAVPTGSTADTIALASPNLGTTSHYIFADDAATVDASGYTATIAQVYAVEKIEFYS